MRRTIDLLGRRIGSAELTDKRNQIITYSDFIPEEHCNIPNAEKVYVNLSEGTWKIFTENGDIKIVGDLVSSITFCPTV